MELSPAVSAMGWYDYAFEVPAGFAGNFYYIILQATSDYEPIYMWMNLLSAKRTITLAANPSTAGTVAGGGIYIEERKLN